MLICWTSLKLSPLNYHILGLQENEVKRIVLIGIISIIWATKTNFVLSTRSKKKKVENSSFVELKAGKKIAEKFLYFSRANFGSGSIQKLIFSNANFFWWYSVESWSLERKFRLLLKSFSWFGKFLKISEIMHK